RRRVATDIPRPPARAKTASVRLPPAWRAHSTPRAVFAAAARWAMRAPATHRWIRAIVSTRCVPPRTVRPASRCRNRASVRAAVAIPTHRPALRTLPVAPAPPGALPHRAAAVRVRGVANGKENARTRAARSVRSRAAAAARFVGGYAPADAARTILRPLHPA